MNRFILRLSLNLLASGILLRGLVAQTSAALTPEDFGYNAMDLHTNRLPLLVILADFGGNGLVQSKQYYDSMVFNTGGTNNQTIVGYFLENSNGRFTYNRAGIVGPIPFSNPERSTNLISGSGYESNIIYRAMSGNWFDFRPYVGSNRIVENNELVILVIGNDHPGGIRGIGSVTATNFGSNVTVQGSLALAGDAGGFIVSAHELTHMLGPTDFYGACQCLNTYVSIVGGLPGPQDSFHLDPWNKMRLGWDRPRLLPMHTGGVVSLPAAYLQISNAPVILYDTNATKSHNEFFMLEYRTTNSYDRSAGAGAPGLAVWYAKHDYSDPYVAQIIAPAAAGLSAQGKWGPCNKCEGLFYVPNLASSRCPADGTNHTAPHDLFWMVFNDTSHPGQSGWRWCRKCEALFYGQNQSSNRCPNQAGGLTHDGSLSPNYSVRTNQASPNSAVAGYRRCQKCQGMFSGSNQATSDCPADGGRHSAASDLEYFIYGSDRAMFTLAAPDFSRGGAQLWASNSTTRYLPWLDQTPTATRIHVRPFNMGSNNITIDVFTERDTWVDFNYTGLPENGAEATPYKTMEKGVTNAAWGGIVKFKPGTSGETNTITKPLTFVAPFGTVTIGQ